MEKTKLEISVIIPYYNSAMSILRALDSIQTQSYLPSEVIIIDDFSEIEQSAKFLEEIESYTVPLRILYHKENQGASAARNTGIHAAKYDYVAFLDSDDCWLDTKLELQISYIHRFDFVYSKYAETFEKVTMHSSADHYQVSSVSYFDILKKNLSPVTLLAKKKSIIFFDERFRRCDDFKMSIEALAYGYKIGFIDKPVAYGFKRAIGESGLTKSIFKMSFSYLRACIYIIYEHPRLTMTMLVFILFEILKFPVRCIKVYLIR